MWGILGIGSPLAMAAGITRAADAGEPFRVVPARRQWGTLRMQHRWLVLFVIAAAIPVGVEAGCRPGDVRLAPDESRTVAAFVEAGAPAPDRPWTADDYQKFAKIIGTTRDLGARGLPRFDSAASGPLLTRLVSTENFRSLHNKQLPANERMLQSAYLVYAMTSITGTYIGPTHATEFFGRELAELMAFTLESLVEMWVVTDEFIGTVPWTERLAREGGYEQVRVETTRLIQIAANSLNDKRFYSPPEMRLLAASLEKTLPSLLTYLGEAEYSQIVTTLRSVAEKNCDAQTSATLGRLVDTITYGPVPTMPRAADAATAYASYQTRIQQLALGTTVDAALAQLGLPYEKHTFVENGGVVEEWIYPTGLRERTRLRFDDTGKLLNVTRTAFDEDVSFLHDGSRLMSDWDAARLHRLRAIRVGMSAAEVRAIGRPLLEMPESHTDRIPALPGASRTRAKGDWWVYPLGKLTLKVTMREGRAVEVSELVSGQMAGKEWTHPIPVIRR